MAIEVSSIKEPELVEIVVYLPDGRAKTHEALADNVKMTETYSSITFIEYESNRAFTYSVCPSKWRQSNQSNESFPPTRRDFLGVCHASILSIFLVSNGDQMLANQHRLGLY